MRAAREPRFPREILDEPHIRAYHAGFGARAGDVGLIAEWIDGEPLGAGWTRFVEGYGFVDHDTPELGVAVVARARGNGVGTALLESLLAATPRCNLSVDVRNPARRLYERLGFETVCRDGDWTALMLRTAPGDHDRPGDTRGGFVSELPATAMLPLPASGRRFTAERTVRLGDVDPAGELRLDAVARYLQDVASDDAVDSGLSNALGWVVRRTMMQIEQSASVGERVRLVTYCTGVGRSWAERRTSIAGEHGPMVEAVSLWVHVNVDSGRPARLGDDFAAIYGESAGGRVVSSKLSLSSGPAGAAVTVPWSFRRTDLDPFGHVNNAAHWAVLEEVLQSDCASRRGVGEIEYVAPAPADKPMQLVIARNGHLDTLGNAVRRMWTIVDERLVTALRWTPSAASVANPLQKWN